MTDTTDQNGHVDEEARPTPAPDERACDSPDYDTDLDQDEDCIQTERQAKETSARDNAGYGDVTYTEVCDSLEVVPVRRILEQLRHREMRLQHLTMNSNDSKALACALWHNTCLESLDLEDNGLDGDGLVPVINAFKNNIYITNLSLSENELGVVGAMALDDVLRESTWLTHLGLSGTRLGDKEMEYISAGIQHNTSLRYLDLSHNAISISGAKKLGTAIGVAASIQYLDVSWNHIRLAGAVCFIKGLQMNTSIVSLNLSWNGLGYEGSLALDEALQKNACLKVIDVSNNRINWEGVSFVAKGLKKNRTLQMLKIGNNPINMEGCYELLKAVASPKSNLIHIGLDNIPINGAVVTVVDQILGTRPFSITHGGVLDTRDIIGIRKEKPEDPVTLLVRYLATIGMRIIDLFRMLDLGSCGSVNKDHFIRGLKKIGVPLGYSDLLYIASRLDKQKKGYISYSVFANGVRNHIREERMEDRRQEVKERNKVEQRRRILQAELPPIYRRNYEEDLFLFYASSSSLTGDQSRRASTISSLNGDPSRRGSVVANMGGDPRRRASVVSNLIADPTRRGSGMNHLNVIVDTVRRGSVINGCAAGRRGSVMARRTSLQVPVLPAISVINKIRNRTFNSDSKNDGETNTGGDDALTPLPVHFKPMSAPQDGLTNTKKPMKLLKYINAYLDRRKSQANFDSSLLPP